ncbi:hypothetical protein F4861DRAFT_53210 [Xylaria intraflava]|nr:hypothetical protein F4861DRAFT_53210 [Xylaria intraflava]
MGLSDRLNIDPDKVPTYKLIVYVAQIVLVVPIFILEIVVFTAKGSKITGDNAWPFGLCFLSIPAWIYLGLAPRYERTRRAANPNVMLVVDAVFIVFWLSAFASQAAYDTANQCGTACAVSKAIVGLAFFETLFWLLSTLISVYTLRFYQQNGDLPGYEKIGNANDNNDIDPHKADFSTEEPTSYEPPYDDGRYDRDSINLQPQYPPSPPSEDQYSHHHNYGMNSMSSRHDSLGDHYA